MMSIECIISEYHYANCRQLLIWNTLGCIIQLWRKMSPGLFLYVLRRKCFSTKEGFYYLTCWSATTWIFSGFSHLCKVFSFSENKTGRSFKKQIKASRVGISNWRNWLACEWMVKSDWEWKLPLYFIILLMVFMVLSKVS